MAVHRYPASALFQAVNIIFDPCNRSKLRVFWGGISQVEPLHSWPWNGCNYSVYRIIRGPPFQDVSSSRHLANCFIQDLELHTRTHKAQVKSSSTGYRYGIIAKVIHPSTCTTRPSNKFLGELAVWTHGFALCPCGFWLTPLESRHKMHTPVFHQQGRSLGRENVPAGLRQGTTYSLSSRGRPDLHIYSIFSTDVSVQCCTYIMSRRTQDRIYWCVVYHTTTFPPLPSRR